MYKDFHGNPIDPIWAAELRGFLAGEGNLYIQIIDRGNSRPIYRPRVRISLREDDSAVLEELKERFSGSLYRTRNQSSAGSPTITWDATSQKSAKIIGQIMLDGRLPARKYREVPVFLEAVEILTNKPDSDYGWGGRRLTDEDHARIQALAQKLSDLKHLDC